MNPHPDFYGTAPAGESTCATHPGGPDNPGCPGTPRWHIRWNEEGVCGLVCDECDTNTRRNFVYWARHPIGEHCPGPAVWLSEENRCVPDERRPRSRWSALTALGADLLMAFPGGTDTGAPGEAR